MQAIHVVHFRICVSEHLSALAGKKHDAIGCRPKLNLSPPRPRSQSLPRPSCRLSLAQTQQLRHSQRSRPNQLMPEISPSRPASALTIRGNSDLCPNESNLSLYLSLSPSRQAPLFSKSDFGFRRSATLPSNPSESHLPISPQPLQPTSRRNQFAFPPYLHTVPSLADELMEPTDEPTKKPIYLFMPGAQDLDNLVCDS